MSAKLEITEDIIYIDFLSSYHHISFDFKSLHFLYYLGIILVACSLLRERERTDRSEKLFIYLNNELSIIDLSMI